MKMRSSAPPQTQKGPQKKFKPLRFFCIPFCVCGGELSTHTTLSIKSYMLACLD